MKYWQLTNSVALRHVDWCVTLVATPPNLVPDGRSAVDSFASGVEFQEGVSAVASIRTTGPFGDFLVAGGGVLARERLGILLKKQFPNNIQLIPLLAESACLDGFVCINIIPGVRCVDLENSDLVMFPGEEADIMAVRKLWILNTIPSELPMFRVQEVLPLIIVNELSREGMIASGVPADCFRENILQEYNEKMGSGSRS